MVVYHGKGYSFYEGYVYRRKRKLISAFGLMEVIDEQLEAGQ
jgi:hypothetical protein